MADFDKDSLSNTFLVAVVLCLVCSIIVSGIAVALKPAQQANRELDQKQNILRAAGMLPPRGDVDEQGRGVDELFAEFTVRAVDLDTGEYVDDVDTSTFEPAKAAKDPSMSIALDGGQDIATLRRRENVSLVYIKTTDGELDKLVLPVRGYGLWGTLFGYLALDADLNTISGLGFYTHKETPGLGGEVDNPSWKAQWPGVKLRNAQGEPDVRLVKRASPPSDPAAAREVDALSGATFTSNGVENLVNFWTGELGFGPYLQKLRTTNG
ncbi:MAG: Na(+)-translocating NADH-quinone reductase subunit C [Pseudomonadales bacterium]